eukprot:COSAG01_NODE_22787_length_841_cov_0.938005_1_plen_230_part_00
MNSKLHNAHVQLRAVLARLRILARSTRALRVKNEAALEFLVSACFQVGTTDVARQTEPTFYTDSGKLLFAADQYRHYYADDGGLQGTRTAPAPLVLTTGIGPDMGLHVWLLRSYLGKDFIIFGMEIPIAYEAVCALPGACPDDAALPQTSMRSAIARATQKSHVVIFILCVCMQTLDVGPATDIMGPLLPGWVRTEATYVALWYSIRNRGRGWNACPTATFFPHPPLPI